MVVRFVDIGGIDNNILVKLSFHYTIKHAEFLYITFFWFLRGTHISFKYLYTKFFLLIIQ